MNTVSPWKADFPALARTVRGQPLAFLDSGASAQKPQTVLNTMAEVLGGAYANIHRGLYYNSQLTTAKQSATITVGRFFDAVVDRDVLGQILGGESNARARAGAQGQIEATRIKLGNVRHRIIGVIAQM